MSIKRILIALVTLAVVGLDLGVGWGQKPAESKRAKPTGVILPQDMADALHAVIAADREVYTRWQRRVAEGRGSGSSESPSGAGAWPAPCVFLRQSGELVQSKGAEFSYTLRSRQPLNPQNAPQTELEEAGLRFLAGHPGETYYAQESLGGRRYFTGVYPETAVDQACADCHNRQTAARPVWRPGDLMGGLVVRVALEF